MDLPSVIALLAPKYLFLALIYLLLFLIVGAVRQEMRQHVKGEGQAAELVPGRLKVIKVGRDPQWQLGQFLRLQPQTNLGTDADNTLPLADSFISGHHARLQWDGTTWWIEDLDSTNGTFLNGRRCPPRQPQVVPTDAQLGLGDIVFQLQA